MPEIINRETGEVLVFASDEEFQAAKTKLLADWYQALEAAKAAKSIIENEQALRKEVAALFFLDPKEGVNTEDLENGYKLKLTYKIDRKLDDAALDAVKAKLRDEFQINPDALVETKPSLVTKAYKGLCATNPDAAKVFDTALTIKPASPTLEIVTPKS